jgi:arylsulfatase A-like enzyme
MKLFSLCQCRFFTSLATLLVASFAAAGHAATSPRPPNIVVILSDDYGYGSLGAYGADRALVQTPNLDRLAREGRRFTNAYTPSSVCTPTRYALVTGRYCWRTSLNHGGVANTLDPLLIETTRPTIASLLKNHGYATGFVGKWHLGYGTEPRVDYTKELKPGPLELGFDYQFAVPQNHNDITRVFVENHRVFGLRSDKLAPAPGKLGLDAPERDDPKTMGDLTARAVSWLEQQAGRPAPFFLYFAPIAVHELVTPSAEAQGTSKAGPYGDFIHDLDRSVGRILAALEKQNARENTLIIFTSDNGGVINPGSKTGASKTAMDAGLKINGALRGGKHDVWEGGFNVPFLVRWPGRVPAGTTSHELIGVVDIFATVAAVVGETKLDRTSTAPDSVNVLPAFLGQPTAQPLRRDLILQSANGVYAIRRGPWKWIEGVPLAPKSKKAPASTGPKADQFRPRLINLADDPAEAKDVSAAHPEVTRELAATLQQQRAQAYSRD